MVLNVNAFDEPGISCSFVDAPSATTRWSVRQIVGGSPGGDGSNDVALHVDTFDGRLDKACPSENGTDRLRAVPQF